MPGAQPTSAAALRVGIIGTGAIANLHARAYRNIGYVVRACTDVHEPSGRRFAEATGTEFLPRAEDVCRHPEVNYVDVCTLPDFRLKPLLVCAETGKGIQVQKPIATSVEIARRMLKTARAARIPFGVVSQHRFDESSRFLSQAIAAGRLGTLVQCDAYVKSYAPRSTARPVKGSWAHEGGGALMNQAIHQVDLLRWFAGPVRGIFGMWQLGAVHRIESEDVVTGLLRYANGATGVIQASTACWPGYSERIELHGSRGTAIVTGDRLTAWDVKDDEGEAPPIAAAGASGASDPLAISLDPFERQFRDFGESVRTGKPPLVGGQEGLEAIEIVDAIYQSCRTGERVAVGDR